MIDSLKILAEYYKVETTAETIDIPAKTIFEYITRLLLAECPELADVNLYLVYDGYGDSCMLEEFVLSPAAKALLGTKEAQADFITLLEEVYKDELSDQLVGNCDNEGSVGYLKFKISLEPSYKASRLGHYDDFSIKAVDLSTYNRDFNGEYSPDEDLCGAIQVLLQKDRLVLTLEVLLTNYAVSWLQLDVDIRDQIIAVLYLDYPELLEYKVIKTQGVPYGNVKHKDVIPTSVQFDLTRIGLTMPEYNEAELLLKILLDE
jgi:hypothetical protein